MTTTAPRGKCCGNHDRAAAGRKGRQASPWRHGHLYTNRALNLRSSWQAANQPTTTPTKQETT